MKRSFFSASFLLIILLSFSQEEIKSLLPDPFIMPGMQASGEPEVYQGDYLFDMINGGADVYFEYGFEEVVSQAYTGITGKTSIKVEIYQMTGRDAAFGILSLNALGKQINETKGVFSVQGSGYKMMQKGIYFIMVSYANIPADLEKDMVDRISKDIASKIKDLGNYPAFLTNTKSPCPNTQRWLYFKGNIALRNATYLDFKIPFKYSDGAYYKCDVLDYMVFKPSAEQETAKATELLISAILKSNNAYSRSTGSNGISIKEENKLRYEIIHAGETIILIKYI